MSVSIMVLELVPQVECLDLWPLPPAAHRSKIDGHHIPRWPLAPQSPHPVCVVSAAGGGGEPSVVTASVIYASLKARRAAVKSARACVFCQFRC